MKAYLYFPDLNGVDLTNEVSMDIQILPLSQPIENVTEAEPSKEYEIIWVTNGSGYQWIDFNRYEIETNKIICLKPGQVHAFEEHSLLEGYHIRFGNHFLLSMEEQFNSLHPSDMFQVFADTNGIHISDEVDIELRNLVSQMQKALTLPELFAKDLLRRYAEIFILHLSHQWDGQIVTRTKNRNTDLVEMFFLLLEKNFKEYKMVADYASQLTVTPNYLNEIVKRITGKSAGNHIRNRIGLEAKRKAIHTGLCMKEVAYELGFSDLAHFSKFFKNTVGKNFSDLRKQRVTLSFATATV